MNTNGVNTTPYQFYPGYNVYNPYSPSFNYPNTYGNTVLQQNTQNQNQGILGRMISNPNEITPQEIPMDGTISMFPMKDGSSVYGKYWDSNGQIKTIRFIPENSSDSDSNTDPFELINKRFDELEKMIKEQRRYHKPYRKNENNSFNQNGSNQSGNGDLNV